MGLSLRSRDSAFEARIRARHPDDDYIAYHAPRYATLWAVLEQLASSRQPPVLDIGRSLFTKMLGEELAVRVDTLGFPAEDRTETARHYHFDLNDTQVNDRWRRDIPSYEVVVFAEVLEHLHTSPRHVLDFLRTIVAPGGVLIVQTPNAVAFHKRLQMLCGRNPFELFREDLVRPGHYREYTLAELRSYARTSGFEIVSDGYQSYFDYRYRGHGPGRRVNPRRVSSVLVNAFYRLCPARLKPGLMLVLRRPRSDAPERPVRESGVSAAGEGAGAAVVSATEIVGLG